MSIDTPTDFPRADTQDAMADDWAQALEEQAHANGGSGSNGAADSAPEFESISSPSKTGSASNASHNDIQMVLDIPVQLIVELDALAGEPMDVLVNGYLIAQGEVVVVNDKFGIRLTDIVTPSERMRRVSRN